MVVVDGVENQRGTSSSQDGSTDILLALQKYQVHLNISYTVFLHVSGGFVSVILLAVFYYCLVNEEFHNVQNLLLWKHKLE